MIILILGALIIGVYAFGIGFSYSEKINADLFSCAADAIKSQDELLASTIDTAVGKSAIPTIKRDFISAILFSIVGLGIFIYSAFAFRHEAMLNLYTGKYRVEKNVKVRTRGAETIKTDTTYYFYKVK